MDIGRLARELADVRFDTGYRFENGQPHRESIGLERAEALLAALDKLGYEVSRPCIDAPSICGPAEGEHEISH